MQGTVLRVMQDKGFGFIKGQNGREYFFHRSGLKNVRLEMLSPGQEVTFEDEENSKGLRAVDIFI